MYGYGYYHRDSKTDRERYLENQVQELETERERECERQERAREERMQEYREAAEAYNRSANSWPEALRKQIHLFRREAALWVNDPEPDTYFAPGAVACERALIIWSEVEVSKKAEIKELEAKIKAIRNSIRGEVADRLQAENKDNLGWLQVAEALRTYDDNNCDAWLDW